MCVLPEPVCPYAKSVAFASSSSTASTTGRTARSHTSACVPGSKTRSKTLRPAAERDALRRRVAREAGDVLDADDARGRGLAREERPAAHKDLEARVLVAERERRLRGRVRPAVVAHGRARGRAQVRGELGARVGRRRQHEDFVGVALRALRARSGTASPHM